MTDTQGSAAIEGIRQTIAAYTQAVDDGRTEDIVATFCKDGTADLPGIGRLQGHDEIREAYAKFAPRRPQRHLVLNTLVTEQTEHEATAVSDMVFLLHGEGGWTVQLVGRYTDRLHCKNGTWRFHSRSAVFVP